MIAQGTSVLNGKGNGLKGFGAGNDYLFNLLCS
jgi:hypothetical protein